MYIESLRRFKNMRLYHLNIFFKYSRAVSGLYIDNTIISEFGLSVYKHSLTNLQVEDMCL